MEIIKYEIFSSAIFANVLDKETNTEYYARIIKDNFGRGSVIFIENSNCEEIYDKTIIDKVLTTVMEKTN